MTLTPTEQAEIRTRTTYHLSRVWLHGLADAADGILPLTKKPRLALITVVDDMRGSFEVDPQRYPTTLAAINDPRLGESMSLALTDMGATVDFMATKVLDESVLACNLVESAVRLRRSQASMTWESTQRSHNTRVRAREGSAI